MNYQERQRKAVCEMIKQRRITVVKGAKQFELSYRQMLRVYQNYILGYFKNTREIVSLVELTY